MRENGEASLFPQIFTPRMNKEERGLAAIILDKSTVKMIIILRNW